MILVLVVALAALVRARLVVVTVHGASMSPVIRDGDRLLVRRGRARRAGQLVVFRNPASTDPPWLVKRVAAVEGQDTPADLAVRTAEPVVPPGRLLVRGDAQRSQDSRHFGYVLSEDVLGIVLRTIRTVS